MKATHPHIDGLEIEIDKNDAARFRAAGWKVKKPATREAGQDGPDTKESAKAEDN